MNKLSALLVALSLVLLAIPVAALAQEEPWEINPPDPDPACWDLYGYDLDPAKANLLVASPMPADLHPNGITCYLALLIGDEYQLFYAGQEHHGYRVERSGRNGFWLTKTCPECAAARRVVFYNGGHFGYLPITR